jgi:methylated-DNA-[protein]-cysteine S-methyltransferase
LYILNLYTFELFIIMALYSDLMDSPIGSLQIIANDLYLTHILFREQQLSMMPNPNGITEQTIQQLSEYFLNQRKTFSISLLPAGTAFQQKIWQLLQNIPYGKSISYLQLSKEYGDEKAIRAVGSANGKNPIPVIIPCHRVIGNNGQLVGYSGGLEIKKILLQHEGLLTKELF